MTRRATRAEHRAALKEAMLLLRGGQLDEAGLILHDVIAQDPDQPDARHLIGVWHHERGEHDQAVHSIREAIRLWPEGDPSVFLAHNNLGNVLVEHGEPHQAEVSYRSALTIAPGAGGTWTNLAGMLRRDGRLDESAQAAQQATIVSPDDPQAWFTLARTLVEHGDLAGGLRANARGITVAPRNQVGREEVLRSLTLLDHRDEAAALWQEWLAQQPDNPVAQHHEAACANRYVARASDAYVTTVFDGFASSFDSRLASLGYRAPELVVMALDAVRLRGGSNCRSAAIADLGCGTGLLGPLLRQHTNLLTGVDLSPGMLSHAIRRKIDDRPVYDELVCAEIVQYLSHQHRRPGWQGFDALVAADVFCYFGVLDEVAAAARRALRPGGVLAFTVEAVDTDQEDWSLAMSGRYAHHASYIGRVLSEFVDVCIEPAELRMEAGRDVQGYVVTATNPADD